MLWPTLANGLPEVGLFPWGSSLFCVGGETDMSSAITEKALLDDKEQISMKFESKCNFFIHENAFENVVCEMAAILSRGRWVNIDDSIVLSVDRKNSIMPSMGKCIEISIHSSGNIICIGICICLENSIQNTFKCTFK